MRTGELLVVGIAAAMLAACTTGPPVEGQDISFVGGCWEQHEPGRADFLRLLSDRKYPGGFTGVLTTMRNGEPDRHQGWTFAPRGLGAEWASLDGMGDELTTYTPAPDLPADDRTSAPGEKTAFFWERPGQLFLKVTRKGDFLRLARLPATGSQERYAHVGGVYFEGRLSGCD